MRPTWTNEELVAILERLTLSRVLDYGESRLLRDINVVCLFQNYDPRSVSYFNYYTEVVKYCLSILMKNCDFGSILCMSTT